MDEKVILINGFSRDETLEIMHAVKAVLKDPNEAAFCMGNENNLQWRVKDLIEQVADEHRQMTKRK